MVARCRQVFRKNRSDLPVAHQENRLPAVEGGDVIVRPRKLRLEAHETPGRFKDMLHLQSKISGSVKASRDT